jgi:thymidylate synthase (FAD)
MSRPHLINDHRYTTDYAGIDPAKALCQFEDCQKPKDQHIPIPDQFEWFDHCEVNLIESTFNDDSVCFAAWTSTKGDEADHGARKGLINRLMKDRHGTPFEHMFIQFQVTAPIFVWREHHRHRIGFSYNEESARYRTMRPRFYVPPRYRPMVQIDGTKAMDYVMVEADDETYDRFSKGLKLISQSNYHDYERALEIGVVREVARMCLPVNLMSTCVVSTNARALMNFLSLRVKDADAAYPSNPQWEINQVALEYERHFERLAPLTYAAFIANGRVAP